MDDSREIENLLYTYAEALDGGDLDSVARLFEHAVIAAPDGGETAGYEDVLAMYTNSTRIYPDTGTPCTRHVTTNAIIEVAEDRASATCRSYFTVFQGLADFPLQAIIAGRYHDRFERVDGAWRFCRRQMFPEQFGDLSRHLLFDPAQLQ